MDRAERQKVILVCLLILGVGYFAWSGIAGFVGVKGLRAETAKLEVERNRLQKEVRDAQQMVANLSRIKRERETLEAQLRELSRRLPTEHESAAVLRSVETLAGKSGLMVGQVRRRPNRPQELYVEIPMEVGVGGGYHELLKFADQLAQLPRLVTLNELKVQAKQRTGVPAAGGRGADLAPGSMRADLVAVVFQAAPMPAAAATPAPAAAQAPAKP
ncbi:MAG TPA: type 4a pilus biogenesis protein PilO [Methylomirabilota bacterium]|jgi:type IV pilus assembly protein PilO|nr:type 4a pilus biogenesis protein PilO [Methylomirabilota bacterium]